MANPHKPALSLPLAPTWMTGVAKVESHTCSRPLLLARAETAERSVSVRVGLAGDSEKMSLVFGLMCAWLGVGLG